MIDIGLPAVEAYLKRAWGPDAELLHAGDIGTLDEQGIKRFGYGKPLLVRWRASGEEHEAVLSVMKGDKYGHQFYWDRAAILLFQYETSARLERHVKPLGVGYVDGEDRLVPLDAPKEFFILNEKVQGYDYFQDLDRILKGGFRDADETMARELARWLGRIHAEKLDDAHLYLRRVRDLIGSSECIMGLIDEAYPHPFAQALDKDFMDLERRLVDWRWRLKGYAHRLAVVHGDFHPWNVLVEEDGGFQVLDRSRGEHGEPAGDLATMAINYLLFALLDRGAFAGPFERLYRAYFEEYLERTGDVQVLEVIQPFFVFRGLVIASPEWYPDHPAPVRRGLMNLIANVLEDAVFDWEHVGKYME